MSRRWWQYAPDGSVEEWREQDLPNQCTIWRASWLNQFVAWKHYVNCFRNPTNKTWLDPDSPEWVRPSITNLQNADFWHSLIPDCGLGRAIYGSDIYSNEFCTEVYDPHYVIDQNKWPDQNYQPPQNNFASDEHPWMYGWDPDYPVSDDYDTDEEYREAEAAYVQKDPNLPRGRIVVTNLDSNNDSLDFKPAPLFVHRVWGSVIHPQIGGKNYGINSDKLRNYLEMLRRYYDSLDFAEKYNMAGFFTQGVGWYWSWEDLDWIQVKSAKILRFSYEDDKEYNPTTGTWDSIPVVNGNRHICRDGNGDEILVEKNNGHVCYDSQGNVVRGKCKENHKHADGSEVEYNVQHVCHAVKFDDEGEVVSVHEVAQRNGKKFEHSCYDEHGNPQNVVYNENHGENISEWRGDAHQCHDKNGTPVSVPINGGHVCKDENGDDLTVKKWVTEYEYDQEGNIKTTTVGESRKDWLVGCEYRGAGSDEQGDVIFSSGAIVGVHPPESWEAQNFDCDVVVTCRPVWVFGNSESGAKTEYGVGKIVARGWHDVVNFSGGTLAGDHPGTPQFDDGELVGRWGDKYGFYVSPAIPDILPEHWRGPDWPANSPF